LVLGEIIMLMRGIPQRNALAHRGGWAKTATGSREVRGKILGVIGYGHIGTQIGVLAESLGMQVVYYDIETKLALGNSRPVALEALLEMSDAVTLHVPETAATQKMIGAAQIARMKRGAILLNASRGTVVDVNALVEALRSGHLSGAAIDVFPTEPKSLNDEFVSPLREFDNVLLTPHVGGSTEEAQQNIGIEVAEKLIRYSNNGSTLSSVNFPEVSLPEHPGQLRLLHIHCNQPGVLSALNRIFSEHDINVTGEHLQTNARIGYVVVDVETPEEPLWLKRQLDEVPGTIRTRILF
jgi:D-3-phosphoglycerate dehydrogenase